MPARTVDHRGGRLARLARSTGRAARVQGGRVPPARYIRPGRRVVALYEARSRSSQHWMRAGLE